MPFQADTVVALAIGISFVQMPDALHEYGKLQMAPPVLFPVIGTELSCDLHHAVLIALFHIRNLFRYHQGDHIRDAAGTAGQDIGPVEPLSI